MVIPQSNYFSKRPVYLVIFIITFSSSPAMTMKYIQIANTCIGTTFKYQEQAEAYLEPCVTSKMEHLAVNYFRKCSILDI